MSRKRNRHKSARKGRNNGLRYAIIGGVTLALALVVVQFALNRAPGIVQGRSAYYDDFPKAVTSIGSPDAPVHVIEYFDFQCPACQQSASVIVKPIIDDYVAEGDVRFTYRFFPILGPESVLAAEASYCAVVQDQFWPYQDALFARRGTGNRGTYSRNNLISVARNVGLDVAAFTECIDSDEAKNYVQSSYDHAVSLNLRGTPTFFVNGQSVRTHAQDITNAIEAALAAHRAAQPADEAVESIETDGSI